MSSVSANDAGSQPMKVIDSCCYIALERAGKHNHFRGYGLVTTTLVLDELSKETHYGEDAPDMLRDSDIRLEKLNAEPDFQSVKRVSDADLSCLALAREHDGIVLTTDGALVQACKDASVQVQQMDWILRDARSRGFLSGADILDCFNAWENFAQEAWRCNLPEMLALKREVIEKLGGNAGM